MNEDTRIIRIVASLAKSYRETDGQLSLPHGSRSHIVKVLEGVIVNRVALDCYIAMLSMMEPEMQGLDEPYILAANYLDAILDGRWEDVADSALAMLLLRPQALLSIAAAVEDGLPYYWLEVYEREERRELEEVESGATKETEQRQLIDYELVELIDIAGDNTAALQELKDGIRIVLRRIASAKWREVPNSVFVGETYDWVTEGVKLPPSQRLLLLGVIIEDLYDLIVEIAKQAERSMHDVKPINQEQAKTETKSFSDCLTAGYGNNPGGVLRALRHIRRLEAHPEGKRRAMAFKLSDAAGLDDAEIAALLNEDITTVQNDIGFTKTELSISR